MTVINNKVLSSLNIFLKHIKRPISTSTCKSKIVPSNIKNTSSNEWMSRNLNDPYTKRARFQHYRCRSVFKLIEINEKYKILHPGQAVVDCGAAPGSWTQYVVKKLKLADCDKAYTGSVSIAVDLKHIFSIEGATVLQMDFTKNESQQHIASLLPDGKADVVLSDMAPNATGIKDIDSIQITSLVYSALKFCTNVLKQDGTFLCKTWNSGNVSNIVENLKLVFPLVKIVKPDASYADSSEIFFLCRNFRRFPKL